MKRKRLAHIESIDIHCIYMQAFQYFLTMIWEDAEIADVNSIDGEFFRVDLAIADQEDSHLIMHLWEDWRERLMHSMYSIKN